MPFEETAEFQIAVSWNGSPTAYRFPRAVRLQTDKLKVTRFSSKVSSIGTGANEVTTKLFKYTLEPTLSGQGIVEPLAIEFVSWPDSAVGELMTDRVTITIAQPVPQVAKTESGDSLLLWGAIALVVIGGAVGVVLFLRKREPRETAKTPVQLFLEELTALKDGSSDLKDFQTGLYKNLVSFLNAKYQIDVSGRSTDMIVADLEKTDLSLHAREKISGWLMRAEKEKYSPLVMAPGESLRLESEVRELFEKI